MSTLQIIIEALTELEKQYRQDNQWEYDSLASVRNTAKAEVCEDLARLLAEKLKEL